MQENENVPPKYSVVVPLHNEQENVRELYRRLSDVMTGRYEPLEFLFVDDHSADATPEILAELAEEDPPVFGVQLLAVGLVGEFLTRTHFESQQKPVYRMEPRRYFRRGA